MADAFAISLAKRVNSCKKQVKFVVSLCISGQNTIYVIYLISNTVLKTNLVLFKLKRNGGEPMKSLKQIINRYIRSAAIVMALVILVVIAFAEILIEQGRVEDTAAGTFVRLEQIIEENASMN